MGIQHASGNQGYNANAETVQELVMSTSGITADSNADGAIVNMIPEGGRQPVQRAAATASTRTRA